MCKLLDILGLDEVNAVFEVASVEVLFDQTVVKHILVDSRSLDWVSVLVIPEFNWTLLILVGRLATI